TMELMAHIPGSKVVQTATADQIDTTPTDISVQAGYMQMFVYHPAVEPHDPTASGIWLESQPQISSLMEHTRQTVFGSVATRQWVQQALNELQQEGLVSLPTCTDGNVPYSAFAGIRTGGIPPLPGHPGWPTPPFGDDPQPPSNPYTSVEIDVRTAAACEELLPPPDQSGYTDPPPLYQDINFVMCDDGAAPPEKQQMVCSAHMGWDPYTP